MNCVDLQASLADIDAHRDQHGSGQRKRPARPSPAAAERRQKRPARPLRTNQTLLSQRDLDGIPHPRTGLVRRAQFDRRGGDQIQVRDQGRALWTSFQMSPLFGISSDAAAVFRLRQTGLQINAIHTTLPKPLPNQSTSSAIELRRCAVSPRLLPCPVCAGSRSYMLRIARPFRLDSS